jgi:uncharacterized protein (DUF4415 family)
MPLKIKRLLSLRADITIETGLATLVTKIKPELLAEIKVLEAMPDSAIDQTDAPEIADWSNAVPGKFYRPVKQLLSVRLDSDLVDWFKASGKGYQTRINAALRAYVQGQK